MTEKLYKKTGYVCSLELKTGVAQTYPKDHQRELDDWFSVTICSDPGQETENQQTFMLFRRYGGEREAKRKYRKWSDGHEDYLTDQGCDQSEIDETWRVRMQGVELAMVNTLRDALLHKRKVTIHYDEHSATGDLSKQYDRLVEVKLHS